MPRFLNPELLRLALTHSSAGPENNERLEFLGDAVIGLVIADLLLEMTPESFREGLLTRARARVVRRKSLAEAARRLSLGEKITLSTGEQLAGGANKDRILCGAYEALVGALFLDQGFQPARDFCQENLGTAVQATLAGASLRDPKSKLQELTQERGQGLPRYQLLAKEGEPHHPCFQVRVEVGCVVATGSGGSKKEAERDAARKALESLNRHPDILPPRSRKESS